MDETLKTANHINVSGKRKHIKQTAKDLGYDAAYDNAVIESDKQKLFDRAYKKAQERRKKVDHKNSINAANAGDSQQNFIDYIHKGQEDVMKGLGNTMLLLNPYTFSGAVSLFPTSVKELATVGGAFLGGAAGANIGYNIGANADASNHGYTNYAPAAGFVGGAVGAVPGTIVGTGIYNTAQNVHNAAKNFSEIYPYMKKLHDAGAFSYKDAIKEN